MTRLPLALAATAALALGSSLAAPLVGSTASFFQSGFCRAYACKFGAKDPLGAGLFDFRYALRLETPPPADEVPPPGEVVSVIRDARNVVVSVGLALGVQDSVLAHPSYRQRIVLDLVELAAGVRPAVRDLAALEQRCAAGTGGSATLTLRSGSRRFTLSCTGSSAEYPDALRMALRLYRAP